jgi:hypothetical protein
MPLYNRVRRAKRLLDKMDKPVKAVIEIDKRLDKERARLGGVMYFSPMEAERALIHLRKQRANEDLKAARLLRKIAELGAAEDITSAKHINRASTNVGRFARALVKKKKLLAKFLAWRMERNLKAASKARKRSEEIGKIYMHAKDSTAKPPHKNKQESK